LSTSYYIPKNTSTIDAEMIAGVIIAGLVLIIVLVSIISGGEEKKYTFNA